MANREAGSEVRPAGDGEPLMIVAAGGAVPMQVATAAAAAGRGVFVVGLRGEADSALRTFPYTELGWGQIGRLPELAATGQARDVVLIGSVARRPDFRDIGIDMATLRYLPRILKGIAGGDDTVLGNLIKVLEEKGLRVIGAHEIASELVAEVGHLAGPKIPATARADARVAFSAARAIGALDIGQAAIAVDERVVALEAAEGTDAMIARVGEMRAAGRFKWQGRAGVLAKCAKPRQDLRVDMPTIGPSTVAAVVAAGLAGIVIEAGRVMIAERQATIEAGERTRTFIRGEALPAAEAGGA